jgi:hypothetical protein
MWMLIGLNVLAQPSNTEEVDDSVYTELPVAVPQKALVIPPFQLINPDTLKLGEHDELVCDSYTALGMPYVYDALHSFNARRMDKFGGYLNVKINQGLESIRKKGFNSDVKQLYIQVNPKTLTVHWIAVVGPSEDGKCYVRIDSRGSAGGGLPAVNKQLPRMHNLYPTLTSVKLLDFNENVIKCFDWNGNRLDSVCSFVNIRQHFFKYYDSQIGNSITLEDYVAKYPYTTDGELLPGTKKFVAPKYRTYKVKSGDSLSTIAAKYHTTVSKIKKANGLRSDLIRIGQVLKIPT